MHAKLAKSYSKLAAAAAAAAEFYWTQSTQSIFTTRSFVIYYLFTLPFFWLVYLPVPRPAHPVPSAISFALHNAAPKSDCFFAASARDLGGDEWRNTVGHR